MFRWKFKNKTLYIHYGLKQSNIFISQALMRVLFYVQTPNEIKWKVTKFFEENKVDFNESILEDG